MSRRKEVWSVSAEEVTHAKDHYIEGRMKSETGNFQKESQYV